MNIQIFILELVNLTLTRIVSEDGKRSIRYGNHEMNSSPTKHHYHEETWTYDSIDDVMNVDNSVVRVPSPKKVKK